MKFVLLSFCIFLIAGCSENSENGIYFDGRLETDIIKIVAKTSGELDSIFTDQGSTVKNNQLLAVVNSDRLQLQRRQQLGQLQEIRSNFASLNAQNKQLAAQLKLNEDLLRKTQNLLEKGASTSQKIDELNTQNDILKAQQEAIKANRSALSSKQEQLSATLGLTDLNLRDCRIRAPGDGTILNRFFNKSELVNPGMLVFEMANLNVMEATIYVSLKRLSQIKLNQNVKIKLDGLEEVFEGSIKWISSEAEFTPKTILTEETRTSLVYAVKVQADNPQGKLKIGMPVQVLINMEH